MCGDNNADLLKIDLCNYNIFCSFIQNRKNEQISYFKIKKKKTRTRVYCILTEITETECDIVWETVLLYKLIILHFSF